MGQEVSSEYAYWPLVITHVALLGGVGLFLLIGLLFVAHAYWTKRLALLHVRFFGVAALSLCGLITLDLAVVQGMDVVPTAATAVLSLLTWTVLAPVVFVFLGGNAELVLWLKGGSKDSLRRRRRAETLAVEGRSGGAAADSGGGASRVSMINFRPEGHAALSAAHPEVQSPSGIDGMRGPGATRRTAPKAPPHLASPSTMAILLAKRELDQQQSTIVSFDGSQQNHPSSSSQGRQPFLDSDGDDDDDDGAHSLGKMSAQPSGTVTPPTQQAATRDLANSGADAMTLLEQMSRPLTPSSAGKPSAVKHSRTNSSDGGGAGGRRQTTSFVPVVGSAHSLDLSGGDGSGAAGLGSLSNSASISPRSIGASSSNNTSVACGGAAGSMSSSTTTNTTTLTGDFSAEEHGGSVLRAFLALFVADVKRHYLLFGGYVFFALASVAVTHVVLFGLCVLNKPTSIDTWLIRKSLATFCEKGTPCFTYPMVGESCSTMVIVSHLRIETDADIPTSVTAKICDEGAATATTSTAAAACSVVTGVVRSNDNIGEDRRYIANVYVQGLRCGGRHTAAVTFSTAAASKTFVSETICFSALPGRATRGDVLSNSVPELRFIEGGDYVVKGRSSKPSAGKALLLRAMAEAPDAAFFALIGDLAYENNMRRCYRRVDEMLSEVLDALRRPADGCVVPIAAGIGNHDGGGYLWAGENALSMPAGRAAASSFYLTYFPTMSFQDASSQQSGRGVQPLNGSSVGGSGGIQAAPSDLVGDYTSTFSVHLLGSNASLVVADSGHLSPLPAQAVLLRDALASMRSLRKSALVAYHVPMYPSTRLRDSGPRLGQGEGHSQSVLEAFGPVLADYDDVVTLVFEHHDHNYKRTSRVHVMNGSLAEQQLVQAWPPAPPPLAATARTSTGDAVQAAAHAGTARQRGRGVVFNGDGAMGASDDETELSLEAPVLQVGRMGNYVTVASLYSNGTLTVKAIDTAAAVIDHFTVY